MYHSGPTIPACGRTGLETNAMFLEFILPNLILGWVGIGFVVSLIASLFV